MIWLHIFVSMGLAGLAYWMLTSAGVSGAVACGAAAATFVLYWLGWVVVIGEGDPGDWF